MVAADDALAAAFAADIAVVNNDSFVAANTAAIVSVAVVAAGDALAAAIAPDEYAFAFAIVNEQRAALVIRQYAFLFLDASSNLFEMVCLLVPPSIHLCILSSFHPSANC